MGLRLTPQDTSFYDLFAVSAAKIVDGSRELTNMLGASIEERVAIAERMREIEHQADEATHTIMRRVNSSFITPFDREDIHALAAALDDCVDYMDAAVDLMMLYQLNDLPAGVADQIETISRMAELTSQSLPRLRSMKNLDEYWIEINRLENQADSTYRRLLAELFNDESANAIRVMKLKEVIDELEAAADAFERVAHQVEAIAVKES